MDPIDPATTSPPTGTRTMPLGGIRRGLATIALAASLVVVGGAAVVMAASPEPSTGTTPSTQPSTTPSTTDDSGTPTQRSVVPCPEGSDGQAPTASPSTGSST